jgi:hypothetical protein
MRLTKLQIAIILESLEYAKMRVSNSNQYPNYEYKMERIKEVDETIKVVRDIRKVINEAENATV